MTEARETIARVIVDPNAENPDNHGLFFGLGRADAILAALPSILAGRVELDFTHDIDGSWHADGVKGTFTVYFEGAYGWLVILNGSDDEWADYPYDDYGFEKREDAIECCNKENRATILKALGMKGGE